MLENPSAWSLYRAGVPPDMLHRYSQSWFASPTIGTVIDIGAHVGYFSRTVLHVLPHAAVYAFEPLPECRPRLAAIERRHDNFHVYGVGLGSEEGDFTFYRNPYIDSSSFLHMTDLHRVNFPFTSGTQQEIRVPVRRLDSYEGEIEVRGKLAVKMDVQGFEGRIIEGGTSMLSKACLAIIEVSFASLYEDAPYFERIASHMSRLGFTFQGLVDQLIAPTDGSVLSADAIFVAPDHGA